MAIGVVAVVLLAAILVGVLHGSGSPSTPTARTTPSAGGSTSAPAAPAPTRIALDAAGMVGRPVGEVQARLTALGLVPRLAPIQTTSLSAGTVIAVSPTGAVDKGLAVSVTFAVAPPAVQRGRGTASHEGGDGGD